ncbi:hypothetical protein [Simplicispira metamorpha]|uniref:Helix-turn-helix protein n=1 Tax=Simplicispira metamorpha TaxID=80881 RepID=A0A4R2NDH5_9BURK|nr:hypothetical protein [Simplicispira metamorpha]TCP19112.1 hypothetical protein EV674_107109 [Simplicispira metamorpha]
MHSKQNAVQAGKVAPTFPPIELEHRPVVPTNQAAHYLSRRPQTLRGWACNEDGPLRPLRLHGRLLWSVADIRRLLGLEVAQ